MIGSLIGMAIGNRLPERIQSSVLTGLGLITLVVGLQNANLSGNIIIPLLATVIGVIIGEWLRIDAALERFGAYLQQRFGSGQSGDAASNRERFITGFVTASLVFCVGPLTFVGSIQDGMGLASGFQFLAIKSVLDGFAAMAFASTFGLGVLFTVITILIVQGGLAVAGSLLVQALASPEMTNALAQNAAIIEMTAVGGILLMALALVLLDVKKSRVANFLPALVIAPLMVIIGQALNIPIYPL
ncbi:MAG: DUF554 domain-containing protein [Anaerolineae bacterium]|nr:DUF554 domain-containing protein [Anaerolineae bacterium]